VRGVYAGPEEEGKALLKPWREWKQPEMDLFQAIPFSEVAKVSNDPVAPSPSHSTGAWMRELSDEAIDTLIRFTLPQGGPPALTVVEVRHAGGAISRVEQNAAAFSRRDAELVLFCVGMAPTAEASARLLEYTNRMKQELAPALTGGVYMNFIHGKEARERTSDGYSQEAFRKLQAVKAKYDPENYFRFSYDIAPKASDQ
jgi:hypothetical protein